MPFRKSRVFCAGSLAIRGVPALCDAAVAGGFDAITLWPQTVAVSRSAGFSLADQVACVRDRGLRVEGVDPLLTWLPDDPVPEDIAEPDRLFYELADHFGARSLNVAQGFGSHVDPDRAAEALAGVCDRAASHGLEVTLEFLPWSGIPDLEAALSIVERSARPNARVMIDTWHHFRSGGNAAALRDAPGARIGGLQINDAPRTPSPDPIQETMAARRLPGDGDIPLREWLGAILESGADVAPGVEVFSRDLESLSAEEVGRRCGAALRRLLPED